jgi:hypothetical protein
VDLNAALKWLNTAIADNTGHILREPEIVILKGTWRGLTYDQMASGSDYSTNYLMRDVAPKLWKQLSNVFGRSVGKTNFRVALEAYAANKVNRSDFDALAFIDSSPLSASGTANPNVFEPNAGRELAGRDPQSRAAELGLYSQSAAFSEPVFAESAGLNELAIEGKSLVGETMYGGVRALTTAVMYGYEDEFAQVMEWVSEALPSLESPNLEAGRVETGRVETGRAIGSGPSASQPTGQLVGIWGLRGIGKTLLVEKLVEQIGSSFGAVVWRSLSSQPSLNDLSISILAGLGIRPQAAGATAQLLTLMTQRPLLIVLEGTEAILRANALAGDYQATYQDYGEFFQAAVGSRSCIVATGIEGPADWVRQSSYSRRQSMRSLTLSRLSDAAAIDLLQAESLSTDFPTESIEDFQQTDQPNQPSDLLSASPSNNPPSSDPWIAQWPELIARYQGHPLALKSALRVIREIFNGRVDEFLEQSSLLFTDILRLLAPSFERLSRSEIDILYWLASQEAPLSLVELQQSLLLPASSATLISVLDSLKQRSLLEVNTEAQSSRFYPPALVKAYAVHRFMGRFGDLEEIAEETVDRRALETSGVRSPSLAYRESPSTPAHIINLSEPAASHVQLSEWFNRQFDADWQSLERLFEDSARPVMRLRNAYHLQAETFVKRCKSIQLSPAQPAAASTSSIGTNSSSDGNPQSQTNTSAVLLVAIHQDAENLYKICVQVQPAKEASVLPENLELKLLDTQQNLLATVAAQQDDSFVQLPYFRGVMGESFTIELALGAHHHAEAFVI